MSQKIALVTGGGAGGGAIDTAICKSLNWRVVAGYLPAQQAVAKAGVYGFLADDLSECITGTNLPVNGAFYSNF